MNRLRKKLILWDNDGVLVDTEKLYYEASREALAELGVVLTMETFLTLSLQRGLSVLELPETEHLSVDQLRTLRARRDLLYSTKLEAGVLVLPGIKETIKTLYGDIEMAIVTSCRRDHFQLIHRQTGLLDYFDFVLVREDYARSKPHPEPYLTALEKADKTADEALVIEDSPRGIRSANAAGIETIAISHPMNSASDLSAAKWMISNPAEIIHLLSGND